MSNIMTNVVSSDNESKRKFSGSGSHMTINLVSSESEPLQKTQGNQSGVIIGRASSEASAPSKQSGDGSKKHQRFLKARRFLERKGYLNDKQNKYSHKRGQSFPGHHKTAHNHQGQPPWQNGVRRPSLPTTAHTTSLPRTPQLDGVVSSGPKPAVSTDSTAALTVTVRNTSNPEQSKKSVNFNSTATAAQAPRTKTYTASLPNGSMPIGNPTKYLAIDCEMVGTGPKGSVSQLARCSIVSYDGDVVYDKFIKPSVPVTDYRTRWSGIRWTDLVRATPYIDARKEILRLLAGKVVIGHAIHNDFKVLGYSHPAVLTRDTSRIPLLNQKAGFGEKECASLKRLTKAIFNRDIQTGKGGHSSVEDAKATMELYKVVEAEWERTLASRS